MAAKRAKPKREKKIPNVQSTDTPSADELFVKPPVEFPEQSPIISTSAKTTADVSAQSLPAAGNRPAGIQKSNFVITQRVLIAGITISGALLIYSFVFSSSTPSSNPRTAVSLKQPVAETNSTSQQQIAPQKAIAAQPQTAPKESLAATTQTPPPKEVNQPGFAASTANKNAQQDDEQAFAQAETAENPQNPESSQKIEPLSLHVIDDYFTAKDYVRTYNACNKLRQNLSGKEFELVRDFLYLRMAICISQKSSPDKANEMFRAVAESRSITLKALANYNLCLLEMNAGHYLKARTKAYKTIAMAGAIASDYKWALNLERNCQFLAAEAITRQTLSLSDTDKELPKQLWYRTEEKDPLTGLSDTELQNVLSFGIERFNAGLLAPQIQSIESSAGSPTLSRWSVVSNGPGIEEFMARFASDAGFDVKWAQYAESNSATEHHPVGWNRPVCLYLPASTAQHIISVATGSVGLLAQINDTNTVVVTDPTEYIMLSEHTRMMNEHSIWLWRKLLLTYSDDHRIANAHFTLGVLYEQKSQESEALSEYKLVANRYTKTPLAPVALLRSSRLKTALRDYQGAARDLKQLIEQYPENDLIGQAYLNLAETTMKAGLFDQAGLQYRKSYNLALSNVAKAASALGAGKCYYQQKDYASALKWLNIYFETIDAQKSAASKNTKQELQNNPELYTACLLLGKTHLALGNLQQACEILDRTAKKADASDDYAEAVATLAEAQMKQHDLVSALNTIETARLLSFSQEQTTRLLLIKSRILRESGLIDQASALLADRIQYLTDNKLKAYVTLEMARCEVAANHLDTARSYFTDALTSIDAGPDAQDASLELAEVCLKLKDYKQTISICKQLLNSSPPEQIKQKASKLVADAYSSQKDYDKAAMALLASSTTQSTTKENKTDTSDK